MPEMTLAEIAAKAVRDGHCEPSNNDTCPETPPFRALVAELVKAGLDPGRADALATGFESMVPRIMSRLNSGYSPTNPETWA